jgi:hypothetical protein
MYGPKQAVLRERFTYKRTAINIRPLSRHPYVSWRCTTFHGLHHSMHFSADDMKRVLIL